MRLLLRVSLFNIFLAFIFTGVYSQSGSNMGKEFYTTFADHIYQPALPGNALPKSSSMVLYIRANQTSAITVELLGGPATSFSVPAGQTFEYVVPPSSFLGDLSNGKLSKAIHITSDNDVAIFAELYGVGGGVGVTSATMLLPVTALGQDYKSLNFTQLSNSQLVSPPEGKSYSFFNVIATADNTVLQITLPATATIYNGDPALNIQTAAPAQITLNRGDVYQALSDNDLTDAHIKVISPNGLTCNPIAVFSGSTKIYLGNSATNCNIYKTSDNLFQQVAPTSTWGGHFITAPLKGRESDLSIYRILFDDINTNYTITGAVTYQQTDKTKGYVEFSSALPLTIAADKPIQVAQYALTQYMVSCPAALTSSDTGDPDMIYLTPLEQGVNNAAFYSTGRYSITNSYVNVVMPTAYTSTFKLDGSATLPVGTGFTPIPGNTGYSYARIPVNTGLSSAMGTLANGTHAISADQPFVATAYGFGTYESYGYTVGANFNKLNRSIVLKDASTGNSVSLTACSGITYTPQLILPFTVNQIEWTIDGTTVNIQQDPALASTIQQSGQALYSYNYFNTVTNISSLFIGFAGAHQITANFLSPYSTCQETISYNINIQDAPKPIFTTGGSCVNEPTSFSLTTPSSLAAVSSIVWNFGDNSASTPQTAAAAAYTFSAAGNYTTSVTINYANGCSVTSDPVVVHITDKPIAGFTYSSPECSGKTIQFTDKSDTKGNAITWAWDFGDGTTSTSQNPSHTYLNEGNYLVKLIVTGSSGCQSVPSSQVINVHPTPVADFTAPNICLNGGNEQFTNTSDFKGEPESSFTFKWDFGDPGSPNNTSILKDPQHMYAKAGTYNVSLSVISQYGCTSAVVVKQIVVNASNPVAAFDVNSSGPVCSGSLVVFQDKSAMSTGDIISKVVWHWGDGSADEVYTENAIHPDGVYSHTFAFTATTPTTQTYNVTLDEYTGLTCVNSVTKGVVVNANPVVNITSPGTVCENAVSFTIVTNLNGFAGTGNFSGDGITSLGLFNPAKAGPGIHAINYVFTSAQTGCQFQQTLNITVNPAPSVTAGPDLKIETGESLILTANATGANLTYKWTPSAGLDHDDILNPVAAPPDDTKYTLTVTSSSGCTNAANISVTVLKAPKPANTFTPNGDGVNDYWYIDQLERYPDATVNVYNRSGAKVFSSVGYTTPWDGKYNGSDLPVGVYYYIVTLKNGKKAMSGHVTIVR